MSERRQSGVVPYRHKHGELQILIISKDKVDWGFPKGGVKDGMSDIKSALKEAYEEAGIDGQAGAFVGATRYEKKGVPQLVKWYMMEVTKKHDKYPEKKERYRKWVSPDTAIKMIRDRCRSPLVSALTRLR